MPINIPDDLPAYETLKNENIFVMPEERAIHQDIRALEILFLNLMPTKIVTETQILRLLSNSPLQVEVDLLYPVTHDPKNAEEAHMTKFYNSFYEIKDKRYDGFIITGAPVEHLEFPEVDYWAELKEIMDWSLSHVFSTFFICWGAQAGLNHHYGIPKYPLSDKLFGVFKHKVCRGKTNLMRGFDDEFWVPHSRYTEVREEDINIIEDLEILSVSQKAGIYLVGRKDRRQIFATGHSEYDAKTLQKEYERDLKKGLDINIPENYFKDNDPQKPPVVKWKAHANLLFSNWLNYCVYQETPYDLSKLKHPN